MNRTRLLAVVAAATVILSGCTTPSNTDPTPTPAPSITAPSVNPEPTRDTTEEPAPQPTNEPTRPDEPEPTSNPEPKPSATTEAGTPATQFAARWGKRYPDIPEFAILKAANGTCRAIEAAGADWNDNALTVAAIEAAVSAAGLSGNDAIEFAQDANQNYCSSVSNPT